MLSDFTTLSKYCIDNKLSYLSSYVRIKKSKISYVELNKTTFLYYIKDLDKVLKNKE